VFDVWFLKSVGLREVASIRRSNPRTYAAPAKYIQPSIAAVFQSSQQDLKVSGGALMSPKYRIGEQLSPPMRPRFIFLAPAR